MSLIRRRYNHEQQKKIPAKKRKIFLAGKKVREIGWIGSLGKRSIDNEAQLMLTQLSNLIGHLLSSDKKAATSFQLKIKFCHILKFDLKKKMAQLKKCLSDSSAEKNVLKRKFTPVIRASNATGSWLEKAMQLISFP